MIKKYKVKCNLFWNLMNYSENDEIAIEETIARKYPHFFEEIICEVENETGNKKLKTQNRIVNKNRMKQK